MACGEKYTIAVSQDGTTVYATGLRGSGQFGRDNWNPKDVFVPVVSVYLQLSALDVLIWYIVLTVVGSPDSTWTIQERVCRSNHQCLNNLQ